ncbi:hypothetical protein [Phytohabitans rumicis]|uniref:CBM6 domain-containing protein n=1 Tax=Phytohabitans rumicis TaxID=1076125 RepID=A0A6V8LJB9_9ACTN|nr:hypothetical protein [Phytohabitans rumicis]GFJ92715.1 hypothetical protein Prum_063570 [Phytohabitans rumicis]
MGGGRAAALAAEISRYVYQGRRRVGEFISPRQRQARIATITVGVVALLLVVIVAAISPDGEEPAGQGLALPTEQPPPAEATAAEGLGSATPGEPGTTAPATPSRTPRRSTAPAIPPPPRTPAGPTTTYYEAEDALLIGAAEVSNMPEASGGQIVHDLGTDQYGRSGQISFTRVTVPIATRYALTVFYVSGENRYALLSVNNGPAYQLGFPSNGGWDRVGRQTFTISLNAGQNSLTFSNPYGWAPRLDRISILG